MSDSESTTSSSVVHFSDSIFCLIVLCAFYKCYVLVNGVVRSRSFGNITVSVVKADITELNEQVDVIVNTTAPNLDLTQGAASRALLAKGGRSIQTEVNLKKGPGKLAEGSIVVTSGGNLDCTEIYHTTLQRRRHGRGQLYTTLIRACLDQASKDGHKSLSLPPLGTGYLAFPPDLAAHYTISAIQDFVRSTRRTSVEKVVIVIQGVSSSLMRNLKPYQRELSSSSRGGAESLPRRMTPLPERMTPEYCSYRYQEEEHPPAYWTNFTSNLSVKDWKVRNKGNDMYTLKGVDRPTFSIIERFIRKTWRQGKVGHGHDAQGLTDLGCTGLKVNKIERIENLTLFEQYTHRRQILLHEATEANLFQNLTDLKSKNGLSEIEKLMDEDWRLGRLLPEVNEGYLFHGTKEDRINGVVTQGLDPRLAQGHAVLGQAIYLAESSTKADQYTDLKDNRTKTGLKMFLVRACLGNIHLVNKCRKLKRPPCTEPACLSDTCDHEKRFHSVVEEEQFIFREFVVYDSNLVYPEYLISYDRV